MNDISENIKKFNNYKELILRTSRARRHSVDNPEFSTSMPEEIRIQLTTDCNLRCKHCFQWNQTGYYGKSGNAGPNNELPYPVLEKIIDQTRDAGSAVFLWGGEPLIYSGWDSLTAKLKGDRRQKVISTNGIYVNEKLSTLNLISENLEVVFSIDGLAPEHDRMRGKGTFNKTIKNIHMLIKEKEVGRFKGKITVNCSISNYLVPVLHAFVDFWNSLNIDKLVMGFPWYINERVLKEMDEYYYRNFDWLHNKIIPHSWYSFTYHIDSSLLSDLEKQVTRINDNDYHFQLRFNPDITNDIRSIISGEVFDNQDKVGCIAPSCRMAVWANGDVSFCGDFPEFCIDNLLNNDIEKIWKSEKFNIVRRIFNTIQKPASLCQRCRFFHENLT